MKMACRNTCNIQCVTYQKIVLLVVLNEDEKEDETARTRQIWHSQSVKITLQTNKQTNKLYHNRELRPFNNRLGRKCEDRSNQPWSNNGSTVGGSTMDQWQIKDNIQCVTFTRTVLLAVPNEMWEREWNCMDTSNLTVKIVKINFLTVKYCSLLFIFSAQYVGIGYIKYGPTDQWCIVGISILLVAPDDSLLEIAPPPLRKRTRNRGERFDVIMNTFFRKNRSLCIPAALLMMMARLSARQVPCNFMTTAASSTHVLECWPTTRSELWGISTSWHMTPALMAGSFEIGRFSRNDWSVASTW